MNDLLELPSDVRDASGEPDIVSRHLGDYGRVLVDPANQLVRRGIDEFVECISRDAMLRKSQQVHGIGFDHLIVGAWVRRQLAELCAIRIGRD